MYKRYLLKCVLEVIPCERNLDAFNDILRGGFGRHDYGEPILIVWKHFERSKRTLGGEAVNLIEEIILDSDNSGHDCVLVKS
ncbi:hypothetical protein DWX43_02705 [Clostridium sp. AF19-22AC]|nr:hypothetical protein DWX43_02705 [Clostridium sp. AF19-22AC]